MKILFSNLGYAKGISGSLAEHVAYGYRHVYQPPSLQRKVLQQFRHLLVERAPDLCCMVELDTGSLSSSYLNQWQSLMCAQYCYGDVANKYGETRWLSRLPFHGGKSNGFLARQHYDSKRLYFPYGSKRLIHSLDIGQGITLLFTHFSLRQEVRHKQLLHIAQLTKDMEKVILLADFNILKGPRELVPLQERGFVMPAEQQAPTFRFHRWRPILDVCLCSAGLADRIRVHVIPQPFSDHAALLVEVAD